MRGLAICFSGYRARENRQMMTQFIYWVHSMGGRILADIQSSKTKVTHLVTKACK